MGRNTDHAGAAGDFDSREAPPMVNGEVVFEAPWQGRVFGMATAMAAAGIVEWDDFRAHLIEELGRADRDEPFVYYEHFLRALERLLLERGLVDAAGLARRQHEIRARPHDHDHPPQPTPTVTEASPEPGAELNPARRARRPRCRHSPRR